MILGKVTYVGGVQLLNHVQLFATPWTAACQASLSSSISWNLLKLLSIELVMVSNHLILCCPFSSCPQYFPTSEFFPMSQLFSSGGQSIGASEGHLAAPKRSSSVKWGVVIFTSEKAMATHSSILAWKIPWAKEPGRMQSMGLRRVGHD